MNKKLRKTFQFYLENDGYATPPGRAACALASARVEQLRDHLEASGRVEFRWMHNDTADRGPRDWGWSEKEIEHWNRHAPHEVEGCILLVDGEEKESLWGIWDASPEYRCCVEKDLLSEYIGTQGTDLVHVRYPGGTVAHYRQKSFNGMLT